MSASTEALALVALVANGPKYRERLQELIATTEKADAAVANLKVAEKASAEKLEAAEALLGSLTAQTDEIVARNSETATRLEATQNDLAQRAAVLETAKAEHAAQVQHTLQEFVNREQELALKQHALDAHIAGQTAALHDGQGRLRAHHLALRATIAEARQGIAVIAA